MPIPQKNLSQEQIDKICRKKQAEIIANFQLNEEDKKLMEQESDDYVNLIPENEDLLHGTFNQLSNAENKNVYFIKKDIDESELIDWDEHVKTLDKDITELQIEPNKYRFKNDKLVIKGEDFPNLTTIYAAGLGLKEAWFHNLPQLNNLYLT